MTGRISGVDGLTGPHQEVGQNLVALSIPVGCIAICENIRSNKFIKQGCVCTQHALAYFLHQRSKLFGNLKMLCTQILKSAGLIQVQIESFIQGNQINAMILMYESLIQAEKFGQECKLDRIFNSVFVDIPGIVVVVITEFIAHVGKLDGISHGFSTNTEDQVAAGIEFFTFRIAIINRLTFTFDGCFFAFDGYFFAFDDFFTFDGYFFAFDFRDIFQLVHEAIDNLFEISTSVGEEILQGISVLCPDSIRFQRFNGIQIRTPIRDGIFVHIRTVYQGLNIFNQGGGKSEFICDIVPIQIFQSQAATDAFAPVASFHPIDNVLIAEAESGCGQINGRRRINSVFHLGKISFAVMPDDAFTRFQKEVCQS